MSSPIVARSPFLRRKLIAGNSTCLIVVAGIVATALTTTTPAEELSSSPAVHCAGTVEQGAAGPWGTLEYYYLYLEPPTLLLDMITLPGPQADWIFPNLAPDDVADVFREASLEPALLQRFLAAIRPNDKGCSVRPPPEAVSLLSSTARGRIHGVLGQWQENPYSMLPLSIPATSIDCWFEQSGLNPALEADIRSLLYQRGNCWLFSDLPLVTGQCRNRHDRLQLLRVLYRERTLLLRLRVSPQDDLDQIAQYWNLPGTDHSCLPVLQATLSTPGADTLDVVHLLPPLARRLLYTYPETGKGSAKLPDCHWTSLNFFNLQPDNQYLNRTTVAESIARRYEPVPPPYRLGDMLMLCYADHPSKCEHSMTYIAADIVFTKNGSSITEPWILMTLDDVLSRYSHLEGLTIRGYRKVDGKPIIAGSQTSTSSDHGNTLMMRGWVLPRRVAAGPLW